MCKNAIEEQECANHFSLSFAHFLCGPIWHHSTRFHEYGSKWDLIRKQTHLQPISSSTWNRSKQSRGNTRPIPTQNVTVQIGPGPVETQPTTVQRTLQDCKESYHNSAQQYLKGMDEPVKSDTLVINDFLLPSCPLSRSELCFLSALASDTDDGLIIVFDGVIDPIRSAAIFAYDFCNGFAACSLATETVAVSWSTPGNSRIRLTALTQRLIYICRLEHRLKICCSSSNA